MNTSPQIFCEQEKKNQRMEVIFNKKTDLVQEMALSPIAEDQIQPFSKNKEED